MSQIDRNRRDRGGRWGRDNEGRKLRRELLVDGCTWRGSGRCYENFCATVWDLDKNWALRYVCNVSDGVGYTSCDV